MNNLLKSFPLELVSPDDTKTELGCGISKTTLAYFRDLMGDEAVRDTVLASRMNYEYLANDRNWMSLRYYCALLDALVERSGKADAAYEAGQYGSKADNMGLVKILCTASLTPRSAYRFWVYSSSHWNHVSDWTILEMGRAHCRLAMKLRPGFTNTRNNCLAIQGFLVTVPRLWNLAPAKVTEVQCNCTGAERCIYDIQWTNPPSIRWAVIGGLVGGGLGAALCYVGILPILEVVLSIAAGLSIGLNIHYRKMNRALISQNSQQIISLENSVHDIQRLNAQLQQNVEQRTVELTKTLRQLKDSQAEQLVSERHAAIGVLAAGMAHELNNPINAVAISLQGIKEDVSADSETSELVDSAALATRRCRRIVSELLAYSRDSNCRIADVADIVAAAISVFRAEQPPTMEVSLDIAASRAQVSIDSGQLQQAVMNLLNNASEAMNGNGKIAVRIGSNLGQVMISVQDSGPGMSEEVRKRIFDPFFTTKPQGKGTGLGLAITWQLIQRNGGTIEVKSPEGHGSEFVICLPLSRETSGAKGL